MRRIWGRSLDRADGYLDAAEAAAVTGAERNIVRGLRSEIAALRSR